MTDLAAAWQAALAGEQRARFGYGLLGPRLSGAAADSARAAQDAHEQLIADTGTAMAAAGITPADPAADYPDLYSDLESGGGAAAVRLALRLEQDAAAAWRFAYSTAAGTESVSVPAQGVPSEVTALERTVRALAQRGLTGSAVRATQWRLRAHLSPATVAFPGL